MAGIIGFKSDICVWILDPQIFLRSHSLLHQNVFSSVLFNHSVVSDSLWPHELQHARPPCPSWGRWWQPTPVLLPGKSHGRRSLVGCSPWGGEELDTTGRLRFHFSLSCMGEGNGNPLQWSCLENSRDGGAWWAAVYGVAQSRTRLKRLSSSSSL